MEDHLLCLCIGWMTLRSFSPYPCLSYVYRFPLSKRDPPSPLPPSYFSGVDDSHVTHLRYSSHTSHPLTSPVSLTLSSLDLWLLSSTTAFGPIPDRHSHVSPFLNTLRCHPTFRGPLSYLYPQPFPLHPQLLKFPKFSPTSLTHLGHLWSRRRFLPLLCRPSDPHSIDLYIRHSIHLPSSVVSLK